VLLLKRLFIALFLATSLLGATLAPRPAVAQDAPEEAEPTVFDQADALFAQWVVGPLATVMFYDLVFWDDELSVEEATGMVVDGKKLVRHDGEAWWVREQLTVADAWRVFEAPEQRALGQLDARVRTDSAPVDGGTRWSYIATVPSQAVDLDALGLQAPEEGSDEDPVVSVRDLAPFPVKVDRSTGRTVEMEVQVPANTVEIAVGHRVGLPDGRQAELMAEVEEGYQVLVLDESRQAALSVPDPQQLNIPVVVAWLVFGAIYFTLRMVFVNLRLFPHAVMVVTGAYDDEEDDGEISHFQALSSALSATVGLGNISGVAIAVGAGGPGAVFWMVLAGFLGMSSKFTECTLGQMYRHRRPDGSVSGGPMHYLDEGLPSSASPPSARCWR